MPDEERWNKFFDIDKILLSLEINKSIKNLVDFGCGYGTFSVPASRVVRGTIFAIDIDPDMIKITKDKIVKNNIQNVKLIQRDFFAEGSGLNDKSVDYVMLFNILHLEEPEKLLDEAYRILEYDGKLGIIHWIYDQTTPRGPPMNIRPKPEQCIEWATNSGFIFKKRCNLKPYHYGIVVKKGKKP